MAQEQSLYNSVAPLRNVSALTTLIERVNKRDPGLPGMACFHGPSGYGKTTAAVYAANRFDAFQVQIKSCWRERMVCEAILAEMGIKPIKTIAHMVNQIAQELAQSGRPLLIDDAQELRSRGMIGLAKDIYESSGTTVILIGEETLPQSLQKWENVHGRILDWVAAAPAVSTDVDHLAPIYCAGVELAADFKAKLLHASHHSIRRVCVNLTHAKELAHRSNKTSISLADWGKRPFFEGIAPRPRRELTLAAPRTHASCAAGMMRGLVKSSCMSNPAPTSPLCRIRPMRPFCVVSASGRSTG